MCRAGTSYTSIFRDPTTDLEKKCYLFPYGRTEAQRCQGSCWRSHSWLGTLVRLLSQLPSMMHDCDRGTSDGSLSKARLLLSPRRGFVVFFLSSYFFMSPWVLPFQPRQAAGWCARGHSPHPPPDSSSGLLWVPSGPLGPRLQDEVRPSASFQCIPSFLSALISRRRSINLSPALLSRPSVLPSGPQGVCQAGCKLPGREKKLFWVCLFERCLGLGFHS